MLIFNLFKSKSKKIKFRAKMMTKDYSAANDFLMEQMKEHPESEGWKEKKSYIDESFDNCLLYEAICEYHKHIKQVPIK